MPFMNKTSVPVVIINKEAAKSHTKNDSFSGEGTVTIDSDSQQQTASEESESETARPLLSFFQSECKPSCFQFKYF